MSFQIFISYRREGGSAYAQSIYDRLTNHGYECFYDRETMGSGSFDVKIYNRIEECEDFLLVLPINGLNRCNDPEDWVRKEIEHAMKFNKNIIPIMEQGFEFPNDLPDSLKSLDKKNGIYLSWDFFGVSIEKLEREFLHSKVRYSNLHRKYKTLPIMSAILILTIIVIFAFSPRQGIAEINSNDEVTIDAYTKKFKMATLYDDGEIDKTTMPNENDTEKFENRLKKAKQGNTEDMLFVAACYYKGRGVTQDFEKSFEWFLKAAETGNTDGMFMVALLYSSGIGIEENKEQARKYFTEVYEHEIKELNLDYSDEVFALGSFYFIEYVCLNSDDIGENAFKCFMKSADSGYEDGRLFVGFCYLLGIGTERNDEKAFECFNKAFTSFEENPIANSHVAEDIMRALESGNWEPIRVPETDKTDLEEGKILKIGESPEGIEIFKIYDLPKSELNEPVALSDDYVGLATFLIGYCYAEGRGTSQDYHKAFEWFEKSADLGEAEAMANIGVYYWQGKGVEKDYDRAFNWCLRAADAGSVTAMNTLGKIYYLGEGTQQNYEKAFEWFKKAATAGNVDAMKNLSIMYRNGDGVSKDENKAKEWEQKYEKLKKS